MHTKQPLNGRPDITLLADEYGRELHKILISGLATELKMERVLLPTGEFAERLKKLKATYLQYIGLAIVMNDWFEVLGEALADRGFSWRGFTNEEMAALSTAP